MLLYRELDGLATDEELAAFRKRMEDRFGPLPPEGEELLRISPLRRLGRHLGTERLILKNGRMTLYFVDNPESAFYKSEMFGRIISYATAHFRSCELSEQKGKRRMIIRDVRSVESALAKLQEVENTPA